MEQLLYQLRQIGIDPTDPPDSKTIRERAGAATARLALAALEWWGELLRYHHPLPVRLVEAACGADSGAAEFDRFCLEARRLLHTLPPQPRAAAGAAYCLSVTAGFHLRHGESDSVWRGLYAFFFGKPIEVGSSYFDPDEFRTHLKWMSQSCRYDFTQQANLLTCWLAACHPKDWESTFLLLQTFLEHHRMSVDHTGFRDCMAFWLRAVGASPHEPNSEEVLRVGSWVLETLEVQRVQVGPQQRPDFDDEQAWGFFTWAITALARCLPGPSDCQRQILVALARYLEGFSARMALNAMARPSAVPALATAASPCTTSCYIDPSPRKYQGGIGWHDLRSDPSNSWESLFESSCACPGDNPQAAYALLPASTPATSRRIPADLYDRLSRSFDHEEWARRIPPGAAFLGGYELPHSGQPVVVLAYNAGDRVIWDIATGEGSGVRESSPDGSAGLLSPLSAHGLRAQAKCDEGWAAYGQWQKAKGKKDSPEKALAGLARTLCSALVGFHEQGLNSVYGLLVDRVVESVEAQLGGEGALSEADLIFCPRGPLTMAAPALVGCHRKLTSVFRSITVSPSLAIFSYLRERSKGRRSSTRERSAAQARTCRPRLNVLTWCPDNQGPPRRLIKRAAEELSPFTDLWLAAERPMTTLGRASEMTAAGDWNLIFAHGQTAVAGTGARLADGLFPVGLMPCNAPAHGAGVLFLLSCLAGRLAQTPPHVDAFGPITEEAVLTFCLSDRLPRPPTLVGAFAQVVEGHTAVDLGVELALRRLQQPLGGPAWAGFARVLNDLVSEVVSSEVTRPCGGTASFASLLNGPCNSADLIRIVRLAAENPMHFLGVYSCLHFRLTGCEPTYIPAD